MKRILKKEIIISFIVGVILASSIAVYASVISANEVNYKNGNSVSDALDDLYNKSKNYIYTEQQYQDYGKSQYNLACADNGGVKIENFVVKKGKNHYDIGFNPSFVFYTNEDGQCWAFAGDSTLYIHAPTKIDPVENFFYVGNNGFYFNYNSNTDSKKVTLYAVK